MSENESQRTYGEIIEDTVQEWLTEAELADIPSNRLLVLSELFKAIMNGPVESQDDFEAKVIWTMLVLTEISHTKKLLTITSILN